MRTLYYNCTAGICGDMHLGALIDLGVNVEALREQLGKLNLDGWSLHAERDLRSGISGTRCDVRLAEFVSSHDHDHDHNHAPHRSYADIRVLIEASDLSLAVKADALSIFRVLAEAEAGVHAKPIDEVHFHEVGAVDSIIDIVGAAICWELLEIDAIASSPVELGGGHVHCAHGRMPVPAPATARLLENCPVTLNGTSKEATTPTGAAILVGKACRFEHNLFGKLRATATGIGQRDDPKIPNVLQVSLYDVLEPEGAQPASQVWELAVNLDDMTPEQVAFLCEQMMGAGALDAWQTAAVFKKGRSGVVVAALVAEDELALVESVLLKHSTSLGLRKRIWERVILSRRIEEVNTPWGRVRVKLALAEDGSVLRFKPEYEDCKLIAESEGISVQEVVDAARAQQERFGS
ncbi:nickel pincer cofactor biosynthesis protein LarC [Coraliomargarita akajimensis]|uniref:Pyridinium-3,5-bisthiocarboxylic acid mononucleotide nickel insertion protein n=1 Tax=Coraliomargarita akajimensis (strain DSM 45221 / IAM 15411 / JCM 23193 / KCTC 12865 / 04OKA010-24) TaxID=583355 RepID=D5EKJ8_CORAD|nr:nickel pincer cofactor biosynthesis protein LarC [Coraliomargarita akajimensis]ADE54905.1 protein of unknown function DUF111 [Coraliomargarita akajimensis DSM 45221]